MLPAGSLEHRVTFQRRMTGAADAYGNVLSGWVDIVTRDAAFAPARGREQVEAGRLESTVAGVLKVRRCSVTSLITAADRAVFTRGPYQGQALSILSVVPGYRGDEYEITGTLGVAT